MDFSVSATPQQVSLAASAYHGQRVQAQQKAAQPGKAKTKPVGKTTSLFEDEDLDDLWSVEATDAVDPLTLRHPSPSDPAAQPHQEFLA